MKKEYHEGTIDPKMEPIESICTTRRKPTLQDFKKIRDYLAWEVSTILKTTKILKTKAWESRFLLTKNYKKLSGANNKLVIYLK
jgi:hypothetical protein